MHITCDTQALIQGITAVERAVSSDDTQPILTGILFEARDNDARLLASNREISIENIIPANTEQAGACVIEGRLFGPIVRKLPAEQTTLQLQTNGEVLITSGKARFSIQTRRPDDFTAMPSTDGLTFTPLLQSELRNLIRQTTFAVSREETRPVLTGVFMECEHTTITMTATDTSRLTQRQGSLAQAIPDPVRVIIPGKSLTELSRLLDGGIEDTVSLAVADNQIIFAIPNLTFVSRLIEGQYPDYKRVFPSSYAAKVVVDRVALLRTVERAQVMSRKGPPAVRFSLNDGLLTLTVNEVDVGQFYDELSVAQEGNDLEMTYQAHFISDVLRVLDEPRVVIEMGEALLPAVVYGENNDRYRYVVMPVRVG